MRNSCKGQLDQFLGHDSDEKLGKVALPDLRVDAIASLIVGHEDFGSDAR